jgi:hypothetical protein
MINPTFIVLGKSKMMSSMKTSGYYFTLIARDMDSGYCYKVWADTTFNSYGAWDNLSVGDIFTNVEIVNETRKLLSTVNSPKKVPKIVKNIQTSMIFV